MAKAKDQIASKKQITFQHGDGMIAIRVIDEPIPSVLIVPFMFIEGRLGVKRIRLTDRSDYAGRPIYE